jgi:hypothetical protein
MILVLTVVLIAATEYYLVDKSSSYLRNINDEIDKMGR